MLFSKLILLHLICAVFTVAEDESGTAGGDDQESLEPKVESDVYVLTEDNFDNFVNSHDIVLVEFYAPWCGHCKSLEPEYAKAATQLKSNEPPVFLAKVDATEHKDLASRFEVNGFPTLKFFRKGVSYEYDGPRQTDGIVSYMKERSDSDWKPPPEAVITLTDDNFHDVVSHEDLMLVEFYAPWCGHCKSLAPKYEKAAKQLQKNEPPIKLAKVDATVSTKLATEFGITGYPTLKIFRKGKASEYKGEREEYSIIEYMTGQVGDGSKLLKSLALIKKSMSESEVTVVAFFSDETKSEYDTYTGVANDLREDYTFVHTFDNSAPAHYKIKPGSVVVFNAERFHTKHEPKFYVHDLTKSSNAEELQKFIEDHNTPLVGHYTDITRTKRYDKKRPLCLVFYTVDFTFDHRAATQLWRNKVADIAVDYPDITFAILDDEENESMMKDFGLLESGEEINFGILTEDEHRYPMEPMEEFDAEEIREFLDNFKAGKLKRHIKSQPAPKKQDVPVTVVVGSTFESVVLNPKKDVLIMLYAPWCGHCKNLMPVWKKLAKNTENEKNLVIAKLDATANDLPTDFKADGFPTIYYVSAKENKALKYDGGRDYDALLKYLKDNASVSFGQATGKDEL